MDIALIIIWIIVTFLIGSAAGLIGMRYGAAYPIALVAGLVVMANIFAAKIVQFGPFTVPAGVIAFSMIFFITDLLSERWGKTYARTAVWAGFLASLVFVVSVSMVIQWEPAPYATDISEMFTEVLAPTPRIAIAGFLAYLISQHHDVWAFNLLKRKMKGKHLWLRNNVSTIISQLFDSIIFVTIAFYGSLPVIPLILGQWAAKITIALIDTPFLYLTTWLMDKIKRRG